MSKDRKTPSNIVLLMVGESVVGRFEPTLTDEGKTTPAMRLANKFLASVWENEEHELHEALVEGKVMKLSGEPEVAAPKQRVSF